MNQHKITNLQIRTTDISPPHGQPLFDSEGGCEVIVDDDDKDAARNLVGTVPARITIDVIILRATDERDGGGPLRIEFDGTGCPRLEIEQ